MEIPNPIPDDLPNAWDWSDLLDFTLDDELIDRIDSGDAPEGFPEEPESVPDPESESDRIRKRDPRMSCSNFMAGLIPCACPEMDEKMMGEEEEEEEGGGRPEKKRQRTRTAAGNCRCQVPGCEADISELKGYHRRHRVCLCCANASEVALGGQNKRYCQQCGKFHVLSDFDKGKRSCRRKLERHNNRRRRKPIDSGGVEKEPRGESPEDIACEEEPGKYSVCLTSQIAEKETLLESEDGHFKTTRSVPGSQSTHTDGILSLENSGVTQLDGGKDNSISAISSAYSANKSGYSSMCPTGRISFKLYDWNPAEFPRRLRHQIFQWLESMPVELEGYIRPGCTILTAFIAMPKSMWVKLLEDPALYIHDIVVAPEKMLSGKGTLFVYLSNMIFRVMNDRSCITKLTQMLSPKLHCVHPTCFEAGKPMEFVACGSNLPQPKLQFLISFAGKYLPYNYLALSPRGNAGEESACSIGHQLYKIHIPHLEPNLFGPAFIEVENESGLSNFIPVLIGDKNICSEMKIIQQKFDTSFHSKNLLSEAVGCVSESCGVSVLRQTAFSDFLLDIAWLLKEPESENLQNISISIQIQRFNYLLSFLVLHESAAILEKMLPYMKTVMDKLEINKRVEDVSDADIRLFRKYTNQARDILCQKLRKNGVVLIHSESFVPERGSFAQSWLQDAEVSNGPIGHEGMERREEEGKWDMSVISTSPDRSESASLVKKEVVMNMNHNEQFQRNSCSPTILSTFKSPRSLVFLITTAAVCLSICVVCLHPNKVSELAITIRRCLFDNS